MSSDLTIWRDGHLFRYDPIILANFKYLALLSQGFTVDYDVSKKGEYILTQIKGLDEQVLFSTEVLGSRKGLATNVVQYELFTDNPGPYHVYVTLFWYYPGRGVFAKSFRVKASVQREVGLSSSQTIQGDNPVSHVPRDSAIPRLTFTIDTKRRAYVTALSFARRQLSIYFKKRSSIPTASVRPSPELGYYSEMKYHNLSAVPGSTVGPETVIRQGYTRTWSGTRTPGFRRGRKQQLPINDHSVSIRNVTANRIIRHTEWPSEPSYGGVFVRETDCDLATRWWAMPAAPTGSSGAADLPALSRLRDAMGAGTANLAQDIGEVRETIEMVGKTISRIHNSFKALRRGNFPGAIDALWSGRAAKGPSRYGLTRAKKILSAEKDLAENWLELQYGWKPLLADVHDAIEKVSRYFQQSGDFIVAQASGSQKISSSTHLVSDTSYTVLPYAANRGNILVKLEERTKYGVRFKVSDAQKAFLSQTGFTNPVNLTWELLPFSFVVDWFLPIGPWLESFGAFDGLEFVDGYKTSFVRESTHFSVHYTTYIPSPLAIPHYASEDGVFKRDTIVLNRTKLTAWPLPTLPHFKSPWSAGHVLNGLALLISGFESSSKWHV